MAMRIHNPEPNPGLSMANFRKISLNGFGDGHNAYAYSMVWFKGCIYVGTGRANLALLRHAMPSVKMDTWPVECPYPVFSPEFEHICARGEIWRYDPATEVWERAYQSPLVRGKDGSEFARDLGYRSMVVFQGKSDPEPCIYVATWSRSKGWGPLILRSADGRTFEPVSRPGLAGFPITAIRLLVPYKGKLYTAPSGAAGGKVNDAGVAIIYETDDPAQGEWRPVNEPGFGDPSNVTIYELTGFGDYLYSGSGTLEGFQVWRTRAEGKPPYQWTRLIRDGAGRGSVNQGVISMIPFKGCLYIGGGIQNGGYDNRYKIGPAASEILRMYPDGSWDIVVGNARDGKQPLSGLNAGFNNYFCGYLWKMGIHNGWLYAGTLDWSVILSFSRPEEKKTRGSRILSAVGTDNIVKAKGGAEIWRTFDGENWLPVTRNGFNNPYNFGIRNIVSTPYGVFIGTANPYGPRVGKWTDGTWSYVDNPQGGLEIWQGV